MTALSQSDIDRLDLAALRAGGKRAMARALSALEAAPEAAWLKDLLNEAYGAARGPVLGFTGPPGVGKSTLLRALIRHYRAAGQSLGVILVDPSSRRSGGALLGDRIRLLSDPADEGLFIRSMAARGRLGGLADISAAAMVVMRAVYDRVLIETVGVGQSEGDIASVADSVVFCVQPGSGDSLQFMKAGIVELPDLVVVTKADLGRLAEQAAADLRSALSLTGPDSSGWSPPVVSLCAQAPGGVDDLVATVERHEAHLAAAGRLAARRRQQALDWIGEALGARFGTAGLARVGAYDLAPGESPFGLLDRLATRLEARG